MLYLLHALVRRSNRLSMEKHGRSLNTRDEACDIWIRVSGQSCFSPSIDKIRTYSSVPTCFREKILGGSEEYLIYVCDWCITLLWLAQYGQDRTVVGLGYRYITQSIIISHASWCGPVDALCRRLLCCCTIHRNLFIMVSFCSWTVDSQLLHFSIVAHHRNF